MLKTETPSRRHPDLDLYPVEQLVAALVDDQFWAVEAVRLASPDIAAAITAALPRIAAGGRLLYVPNVHRHWALVDAELTHCSDQLVAAAGLPGVSTRTPDSVLYSDGVATQFGKPYVVRGR